LGTSENAAAAAKPPTVAPAAVMQPQPGLVPPPTKPQDEDARKEFTFTDGTGANIGMEIFTCSHCSQVVQTSATVNATRLKTHLSQLYKKSPGEVKTRAFNSGQAAKKQ
jgi:hypothetical protein